MSDPFPAEDFDDWAENYDRSVSSMQDFPFSGYEAVLDKVVELARPRPGLRVLDLGIGTGNLALRFDALGCDLWEDEFYWLANETIPALAEVGLRANYHPVSSCAGVFEIFG